MRMHLNKILQHRVVLRNLCQLLILYLCNPWQSGGTDAQQMKSAEKDLAVSSNATVKMVLSVQPVW